MMNKNNVMSQENWQQKDKRQQFLDKVGAYVIKCGAERDPELDKVFPLAKQIVDKAWEYFPSQEEAKEEKIKL